MVWLHVIDDQIVNLPLTNHFLDILQKLSEEIHLHCVDKRHFLVYNHIRVIAHTIGQRPKPLKTMLVSIVYTHVINPVLNFCYHNY